MRRLILALTFLLAAGLVAGRVSISTAQSTEQPTGFAPSAISPCLAAGKKSVDPATLLLGEQATVSIHASADCEGLGLPLDIVLVFDGSNSMGSFCHDHGGGSRPKLEEMKKGAQQMVRRLKLGEYPYIKVGVVEFDDRAETRVELINRESRVISAINTIRDEGGTAIHLGIDKGVRVLTEGRDASAGGAKDVREFMVVVSDGGNNVGCGPVVAAAGKAKGQGIATFSVCVGPECDQVCMRQVASTSGNYYWAEHSDQLGSIFERIRSKIFEPTELERVQIQDSLPNNMRYVPGSALTEPIEIDVEVDGSILRWQTKLMPPEGITVTYEIEPLESGLHPTSIETIFQFWDKQDGEGTLTLEVPKVLVLDPGLVAIDTPTPTSTPAPTWTPLPPVPTATMTATRLPAEVPGTAYFPVAMSER